MRQDFDVAAPGALRDAVVTGQCARWHPTRAVRGQAFYVAVCVGCGTSPDGDGSEYRTTMGKALDFATTEMAHYEMWVVVGSEVALCPSCLLGEDPDDETIDRIDAIYSAAMTDTIPCLARET